MGTNIYNKGRRKEYKIVEDLRKRGFDIAQRTAGSHSKIDVFGVDFDSRTIVLIQAKRILNKSMDYIDEKQKKDLNKELNSYNGEYNVIFEAK